MIQMERALHVLPGDSSRLIHLHFHSVKSLFLDFIIDSLRSLTSLIEIIFDCVKSSLKKDEVE